jgi:acetyl esterase/lipase
LELGVASAVALAGSVACGGAEAGEVQILRDVAYGEATIRTGLVPLKLDLYRSTKGRGAPRPIVIYVHGGGFQGGDKFDDYGGAPVKLMIDFAEKGFAALSIDYRVAEDQPVVGPRFRALEDALAGALAARYCDECSCKSRRAFLRALISFARRDTCGRGAGEFSSGPVPIGFEAYRDGMLDGTFATAMTAAVEDVAAAIAWAQENKEEYGLDPAYIVLIGASSGAIAINLLAYMTDDLGIEPSGLKGVIAISGEMVGNERYIDADDPPSIIVHSARDPYIDATSADRMNEQFGKAGVSSLYVRLAGDGHSFATIPIFKQRWNDRALAQIFIGFAEDVTQSPPPQGNR